MSELIQYILVGIIVGIAAVYAIYKISKRLKKGNNDADCLSCDNCELAKNCNKEKFKKEYLKKKK